MSKILPIEQMRLAGSREAPATYRRDRCFSCYHFLMNEDWRGRRAVCGNCGTIIYLSYDVVTAKKYSYLIAKAPQMGLRWTLFMLLVWEPVKLLDHYLRLRRLLMWAILRLMV